MNLVFARHPGENKLRLFQVPNDEPLTYMQKILVNTRQGVSPAVTVCGSFCVDENAARVIAESCGSYFPPAAVTAREILVHRMEMQMFDACASDLLF